MRNKAISLLASFENFCDEARSLRLPGFFEWIIVRDGAQLPLRQNDLFGSESDEKFINTSSQIVVIN